MARKEIQFHQERVDRHEATAQTDAEPFAGAIRTYLEAKSVEDHEHVSEFIGKSGDNVHEELAQVSDTELVSTLDARKDKVEKNQQYVTQNLKSWTSEIVRDMDLAPEAAELLEKRLWSFTPVRVEDPLASGTVPEGNSVRQLTIDGTRPQTDIEVQVKSQIAEWVSQDLDHLRAKPLDTLGRAQGTVRLIQINEAQGEQSPGSFDELVRQITLYENVAKGGAGAEYAKGRLKDLQEVRRIMTNPTQGTIEERLARSTPFKVESYLRVARTFPPNVRPMVDKTYSESILT